MSLLTLASAILQFSGSTQNDMGMWGGSTDCTKRYKRDRTIFIARELNTSRCINILPIRNI
ncbi:hypothetical protein V1478_004321 [Vespula squamosa]|uniref:Uncharacterized protein n=1 Tax=Vespula squamosa TaxID=30214 RepID=A0ABD2BHA1_VESSQ